MLGAIAFGCGGNTPAPVDPSAGPGAAHGSGDAATQAYQKCRAAEDETDEAKVVHCYQAWLDEYQTAGEEGQVRHANRMANPNVAPPVHDQPPAPTPEASKAPTPIDLDNPPPPKPASGDDKEKSPFPPQTVGYDECWKGAPLTGDYATDYNNLIVRCGKPTGMLAYSKPIEGQLSDEHKGDVFTVKLVGGACYRIFAVAGGSVKDIDIGLATLDDKVVAADKYTQPVAIIEWAKPFCVDSDVSFKLIVARDGGGKGGYGIGIWFKPKDA